jgi:photosystem II protein PsbQ
MARYRALISLVLVLVATFLVSCGGPAAVAPPPTYTPTQLEKIQDYATGILGNHQRIEELLPAVKAQDYQEVQAFLSGPLGQMLQDMRNLNRNLLPKDQKAAGDLTRSLFDDFVDILKGTERKDMTAALRGFDDAARDFGRYMDLLPIDKEA